MPIYEYECKKCGERLERLILKKADVPGKCPACGSEKIVKAWSSFSVASGGAPRHEPSASCATCTSGGCPHRSAR